MGKEVTTKAILSITSEEMKGTEYIDIFQIMIGAKSCQRSFTFLKSLLHHHKKTGKPIRLHIVCDRASRLIIESVLTSWQPENVASRFYSATKYLPRIKPIRSSHPAVYSSPIKLFIPEILRGITTRTLSIDCDALLLGDVEEMWELFQKFNSSQAVGMAPDKIADLPFNMGKYSLNAGVLMWNIERLNQDKANLLSMKAYGEVRKTSEKFPQAEQTMFTVALHGNSELFFEIPCAWNHQINLERNWNYCVNALTSQKSNNPAKLLHITQVDKMDGVFHLSEEPRFGSNENDMMQIFIRLRSLIYALDGNSFRPNGSAVLGLDFRQTLESIYPGEVAPILSDFCIAELDVCQSEMPQTVGSYYSYHRIHPFYIYENFGKDYPRGNEICLIITLYNNSLLHFLPSLHDLNSIASNWEGCISVAIYEPDLEAHQLYKRIEKLPILKKRRNIAYHIVYPQSCAYTNITLHNTASIFSPTGRNLHFRRNFYSLLNRKELLENLKEGDANIYLETTPLQNLDGYSNKISKIFEGVGVTQSNWLDGPKLKVSLVKHVIGIVIPAVNSLLPNEFHEELEDDYILLLLARLNLLEKG